jgi:dihydrolipoamide dehydrogenase
MQSQKEKTVSSLARGLSQLMVNNKIDVIQGTARLTSAREIEVNTQGGIDIVSAEKIILAPGSVPSVPFISGAAESGIMTSDDILQISRIPASLLIIGGGVVGVEFAGIFAALGAKVTIVEKESNLVPGEDNDISTSLRYSLKSLGISAFTGCQVTNIRIDSDGNRVVTLQTADESVEITAEIVAATAGRSPNLNDLGLENAGIVTHKNSIVTNELMETSVPGIYAVGDAVGKNMLAYIASREGVVAAENAMGRSVFMDYLAVPRCIFCSPEIASVGLTEKEARTQGYEISIGRFPLSANGMAAILKENGFIKIIADAGRGKVLGVHIFAPHATEMIGEATLAMQLGAGIQDISDTIHAHPTLSEGLSEAALDTKGEAINVSPRRKIIV